MREYTFAPAWKKAALRTTTTSTSSVEVGLGNNVIWISNQGTDAMYVAAGDSSVIAGATDVFLPGGGSLTVTKDRQFTHVAAASLAGTPTLHIIPGEGI